MGIPSARCSIDHEITPEIQLQSHATCTLYSVSALYTSPKKGKTLCDEIDFLTPTGLLDCLDHLRKGHARRELGKHRGPFATDFQVIRGRFARHSRCPESNDCLREPERSTRMREGIAYVPPSPQNGVNPNVSQRGRVATKRSSSRRRRRSRSGNCRADLHRRSCWPSSPRGFRFVVSGKTHHSPDSLCRATGLATFSLSAAQSCNLQLPVHLAE
jgi:hypothetical protein